MPAVCHTGLFSLVLWAPRGYEVASFPHIAAKDTENRARDLKSGLKTGSGTDEGKEQVRPMADF